MPNYLNSALFSSFFKAEDFKEASRVLTVKSVAPAKVGPEGRQEEKLVLKVEEDERGITLNKTRYNDLGEIFGSLDTDTWAGKKVKVIFDPSIKFGGRKVGGIACQPAE
jgi:hypothetical protein